MTLRPILRACWRTVKFWRSTPFTKRFDVSQPRPLTLPNGPPINFADVAGPSRAAACARVALASSSSLPTVSRTVRAPSRIDRDFYLGAAAAKEYGLDIAGSLAGIAVFFVFWPGLDRKHDAIRYFQLSAALHLGVAAQNEAIAAALEHDAHAVAIHCLDQCHLRAQRAPRLRHLGADRLAAEEKEPATA